jgi:hypothetical protein
MVRTAVEPPTVGNPADGPVRRAGALGPIGTSVIGTATTVLVWTLEAAVLKFVDGRRSRR